MTGMDMDRQLSELERDLGPVVDDWLHASIEPLPGRVKDDVFAQATIVSQRGRWPWQRRSPRLRVDTIWLGFAPAAALVVVVMAAAMGLVLLGPLGSREAVGPGPAATPPSPSPTFAIADLLEGMVTEPVEPGVVRLVDDGAGHDGSTLSEFRRGPYKLTAAPDGSIWLSQFGGDGTIVDIGRPGSPRHPIGPGTADVDVATDGRLWVANDGIASWDGTGWTVHDPPPDQVAGGGIAAHPDGGVVAAYRSATATEFERLETTGSDRTQPFAEPLPPRLGDPMPVVYDAPTYMEVTSDGLVWLIELNITDEARVQTANGRRTEYRREPSRLLRSDGGAWEQVHPLGEGVAAEPREMVLDPAGHLVVRLGESVVDPDRLHQIPVADEAYGDREWIVRWDGSEWAIVASHDGSEKRPERLLASGLDSVWMTPPSRAAGGSGGIVEYRADGSRLAYLDGINVHDAVVTPDGRTWVVGTAGSANRPSIYIITPREADPATAQPVATEGQDAVPIASEQVVSRWLATLGPEDDWIATPIPVIADTRWRALSGVTADGAWFVLGQDTTLRRGITLLSGEVVQRYLSDRCVHGLTVTPDERVWVTATDHGGYVDIRSADVHVISPKAGAEAG